MSNILIWSLLVGYALSAVLRLVYLALGDFPRVVEYSRGTVAFKVFVEFFVVICCVVALT